MISAKLWVGAGQGDVKEYAEFPGTIPLKLVILSFPRSPDFRRAVS
jgi:hypothetical protein